MKEEYKYFIQHRLCPICYSPFKITINKSFGLEDITIIVSCKHKTQIAKMIEECLK